MLFLSGLFDRSGEDHCLCEN